MSCKTRRLFFSFFYNVIATLDARDNYTLHTTFPISLCALRIEILCWRPKAFNYTRKTRQNTPRASEQNSLASVHLRCRAFALSRSERSDKETDINIYIYIYIYMFYIYI